MPAYQLYQIGLQLTWILFVVALGGCVGSLINVLAYRIPLGKSVVSPPSACPKCAHKLAWYDNLPVVGWLMLRGKCRYCKAPISAEYPIVEGVVALLFGTVFTLYMIMPSDFEWLGVHWGAIRPEWARLPYQYIWPIMLVVLTLLGCLAAVTVIDAKTYMIPLSIPWFATIVALVAHTGLAAYLEYGVGVKDLFDSQAHYIPARLVPPWDPFRWSLPIPHGKSGPWLFGAAFGGVIGLGLSTLLLRFGLIRRSFEDYDEWERSVLDKQGAPATEGPERGDPKQDVPAAGSPEGSPEGSADAGRPAPDADSAGPQAQVGAKPDPEGGPVEAIVEKVVAKASPDPKLAADTPELWIQYPHARREMLKELVFLAPCIALMIGGAALVPWLLRKELIGAAPLWLVVLAGVLMGYLVGGGIVWGVRIFGSLAFGKEAMGLGDVHLWAAVGACLGWMDAVVGFFLAAPVGLLWVLISVLFGGKLAKTMPYGPYLAGATVMVLLGKPLIEMGLNWLAGTGDFGQPGGFSQPINLP